MEKKKTMGQWNQVGHTKSNSCLKRLDEAYPSLTKQSSFIKGKRQASFGGVGKLSVNFARSMESILVNPISLQMFKQFLQNMERTSYFCKLKRWLTLYFGLSLREQ